MPLKSRLPWALSVVLFLAVTVVAWVRVGPILYPKALAVAPLDSRCDLRKGPCETVFPDGSRVALQITPFHIPAMEKLKLVVHAQGIDTHRGEVDFSGADMNMGFNRVTLAPVGPGELTGAAMLPVCVRARMTWEAKVLLYTDAGLMAAPFRFDTYRPGTEPAAEIKERRPLPFDFR